MFPPTGGLRTGTPSYNTGGGLGGSAPQSPLGAQYNQYTNATNQANQDYTNLMSAYRNLYSNLGNYTPIPTAPTYTPSVTPYTQSPNVTQSLSDLSNLAATGGLSAEDQANLRARGMAPVQATYAQAQQNIDRAKQLGGGYAPNYIAATANLARGQGQAVSDATQAVNAQVAQMVQQGKLSAAPAYASAAGGANALQEQYNAMADQMRNQAMQMNIQNQMQVAEQNAMMKNLYGLQMPMNILDQMRSLYGTTPAQPALYGGQAMGAASQQAGFNQNAMNNLMGAYGIGLG
jgi:glycine betaine/choline ABC-type transport system substrate-binding protein